MKNVKSNVVEIADLAVYLSKATDSKEIAGVLEKHIEKGTITLAEAIELVIKFVKR